MSPELYKIMVDLGKAKMKNLEKVRTLEGTSIGRNVDQILKGIWCQLFSSKRALQANLWEGKENELPGSTAIW